MLTRTLMTAAMALVFVLSACADVDPDVEPSDPQPDQACNTNEDCPQLHISVWDPTCSGDVLHTPTGSGATTCVEGTCQMDFELEETDCAAEGKVCELYAGRGTRAGGDACVDPAVRGR